MQKGVFTMIILGFFRLSALAQGTDYPVLSSPNPPPLGIYLTADDFLALHPRDTEVVFHYYAYAEGGGINNFHRKKANGKKGEKIDPRDFFAASDGKTFYISYSGRLHKAVKTDSGYSFIALINRAEMANTNHLRLGFSVGDNTYGNKSAFVPAEYMEDPYRMEFSLAARKWIPVERVNKRRK